MIALSDFKISSDCQVRILDILRFGRLSYGPVTREFESRWAALHNSKHAIFTNSGTSALVLAIAALKARHGWAEGAEVIVPAITFVATANAVIHNKLTPVVVDCEADTFGMDPKALRDAINERTVAVIPVHIMGRPCRIVELCSVAMDYGLIVIEDSCEAVGSTANGGKVGSFGTVGCFSTYAAHPISTGVGGLCVTNDDALAIDIRSLMNHGRDPAYLSLDDSSPDPVRQWEIVTSRFKFNSIGHSFRATELEAAIGLDQLERWENISDLRMAIGGTLDLKLAKMFTVPGVIPMNYPITCKTHQDKLQAIRTMERADIQTRDLPTLLGQPCYSQGHLIEFRDTPVAKDITERTFYIGCHPGMTPDECERIGNVFFEAANGATQKG